MTFRSSRRILSKNSVVSCFIACRRLSSKSGNASRSGARALDIAEEQPLFREIRDQRTGPRVRKHALDLLFKHRGIFQFSLRGNRQQFLVRNTAPQEERQT